MERLIQAVGMMYNGSKVNFTESGIQWLKENNISYTGYFYINSVETDIIRIWSENDAEVLDMEYENIAFETSRTINNKRFVTYKDKHGNELFNEHIIYTDLPPLGRKIEWHASTWFVSDILESWDKGVITVTLKPVEESVGGSKINLLDYLPQRPAAALAQYLSKKFNSDVEVYSWTKEDINSIDRNELKKLRNFGEKSQKQVRDFIEKINT